MSSHAGDIKWHRSGDQTTKLLGKRHRDRGTEKEAQRQKHRDRGAETEAQRDRGTGRQMAKETEDERDRDRVRKGESHSYQATNTASPRFARNNESAKDECHSARPRNDIEVRLNGRASDEEWTTLNMHGDDTTNGDQQDG